MRNYDLFESLSTDISRFDFTMLKRGVFILWNIFLTSGMQQSSELIGISFMVGSTCRTARESRRYQMAYVPKYLAYLFSTQMEIDFFDQTTATCFKNWTHDFFSELYISVHENVGDGELLDNSTM